MFEQRGGRTVLTHAYAEPPFRIGRAFDLGDAAYVIIVCSGPGVFAGDTLRQSVRVARGARVVLTSQSALQVHPSSAPIAARIDHEYDVSDGGELHCHWDPLIPFADSRIEQRFHLRLAGESRAYWSDALMSGRARRGEAWRFIELAHELRLTRSSSLRYLERYRLNPDERDPEHPWMAGAANYLATALIHDAGATAAAAEMFQRRVGAVPDVSAGVDAIEPGLIVARLAAASGPPFARARAAVRDLALDAIFDSPDLVLRK